MEASFPSVVLAVRTKVREDEAKSALSDVLKYQCR